MNASNFQRRRPRQARSRVTYDSILQAAAEVLQRDGPSGLNTNRIADRAGVSVGTLYQYFEDKEAILLALAHLEIARLEGSSATRRKSPLEALLQIFELLLQRVDTSQLLGTAKARRTSKRKMRISGIAKLSTLLLEPISLTVPVLRTLPTR